MRAEAGVCVLGGKSFFMSRWALPASYMLGRFHFALGSYERTTILAQPPYNGMRCLPFPPLGLGVTADLREKLRTPI